MQDLINEPMGFKMTIGGFTAWFVSTLAQYDLTQVVGFIALVIGLAIQISSWLRNRKTLKLEEQAAQRALEADNRDKMQYDLQMRVLAKQLEEIERGFKHDTAV